jgi:ribose transport system substrate-binding protein
MKLNKWFFLSLLLVLSIALAACNSDSTSGDDDALSIGYVVNFGSHEWYQNIVKGAENTAKERGHKFEWADANTDLAKQITQSENLLTKGVDVLALSPVDPEGLSTIMDQAKEKGTKVVTESNPIPGTETTVGIRNLEAGIMAGKWAGEYIKANFTEDAKVLIVGLPSQVDTRDRVEGFKQGLEESGANYEIVQEVDGKGVKDEALNVSTNAITAHPDVNVIFGINDDSALGGQQAYEEAGLDMNKLLTIGFGVEGVAGKEALQANGPYKAGLAMFPEYVGRAIIDQAEKVANGEEVEERTITPMTMITPENLNDYYTLEDGEWVINFDNVEALLD